MTTFAVIIQNRQGDRTVVLLDTGRKVFGRFLPPFTDVPLRDLSLGSQTHVAKRHFEIRWNESAGCHEIRDLAPRYPTKVNGVALGKDPRPLQHGDVIEICVFRLEYVSGGGPVV